jgi:plastocyanin
MIMQRGVWMLALIAIVLSRGASAGTISGKVSGVAGESVVYVDAVAGKSFPAPADPAVMSQKGLMFQPHIVVVQAGATVDFVNNDKVAHNVFWPSIVQDGKKLPGKNLGTWPQGEKRSFKFEQPGVASVLCNVHPEMSGYIVVAPTPYFARTDGEGNYRIENVPDGQYNVISWHEGAKAQTKPVALAGEAKADFSLSK